MGYSFPESDQYVRYLFLNFLNAGSKVTVVNIDVSPDFKARVRKFEEERPRITRMGRTKSVFIGGFCLERACFQVD